MTYIQGFQKTQQKYNIKGRLRHELMKKIINFKEIKKRV